MEQEALWNKYQIFLKNQGVTKNRIDKLKSMFVLVTMHIEKPLEEATREDLENFIGNITEDKIKSRITGQPLSGSTKSDIKKFLKQFFKHFKGNDETYPSQVAWLRTKIAKDEKPEPKQIVSLEQVKAIAGEMKEPRNRLLTLILFDSGFRIDEALSVKKRNITWDIYNEETKQKCWWIECTRSKTVCRKIPVPIFQDDISLFVRSNYFQSLKDDEYVWPFSYENYLKILHRASEKITKTKLSPHCFRHSSATYYAKLEKNIFSLCQRFGWSLSSNEAKEYIRLSGAYVMNAPRAVFDNDAQKLREENEELKRRFLELEKRQNILAGLVKKYVVGNVQARIRSNEKKPQA